MSIEHLSQNDATGFTSSCPDVLQIISPKEKDLGELTVRRLLPYSKQAMIGPWIFFDHMGPAHFKPGSGINVRPHPHINLATVTYLFAGEIIHRDSIGSHQAIHPGDINLMVAGKNIVHSERSSPEKLKTGQTIHGLQLWMALPEEFEEIEPAFYHYNKADLPEFEVNNVAVRLMMGQAYGYSSPVKTFSPTLYLEASIAKGQSLTLPHAEQAGLYIALGRVSTEQETLDQYSMAVLNTAKPVSITAEEDSRIALVGGAPLGKRFIEWNFVSSRRERINEAKQQWRDGLYPSIPGDADDFIPLP